MADQLTVTLYIENGQIVDVVGVDVEVSPISDEEMEIFSKGRVVDTIRQAHVNAACYITIDRKKIPVPCPCG